MKNKGISLISVVITIIIIIILAAITMLSSTESIENAHKVKFQNDLKEFVTALDAYNQRAHVRGIATYDKDELTWDGKSESLENSACIEDSSKEDTIYYVFSGSVPESLDGIITIEEGKIRVDKKQSPQIEWATELYGYMGE